MFRIVRIILTKPDETTQEITMITFHEYLEDVLDLHIGLMSDAEIKEAQKAFEAYQAPRKAEPKHPDMKKPIDELRARCQRLVQGQQNAVIKFADVTGYESALIAARAAVAEGNRILTAKRATKAEYIAHAEMNSNASRAMNTATQAAK
jgi:hypothetical protein